LINGEVEGVLDSKIFARALVDLVRRAVGVKIIVLNEQEEGDLVELLFGVATKMRLDPEVLPAWFYPASDDAQSYLVGKAGAEFAGATRRTDFPLFYLLVDYVYHDGRTGDFARTGLLYLTETASKSKDLERWMTESDLATLMASGLGALYSRLSRRLPSIADQEDLPPILALSDHLSDPNGSSSSPQSSTHDLNAFLSYLLFWQDTLNHCQSADVKDTLLDHFQVLFLQQLLYPSLLESSDVDGGSTASVITYLCQILEALDHPDLVRRILGYLLASKDQVMTRRRDRKQRMSLSRRKSFDALTALAQARDNPSPDLFNLVDLIVMSLKSKHTQTVAASLKLISIIEQRHHSYALSSLIHTQSEKPPPPTPTLPELNKHLERVMSFALVVSDNISVDRSYGEILPDVQECLESHSCSSRSIPDGPSDETREAYMTILEDDVLLSEIRDLLESFFVNNTMTNLALTETIASIASCRLTSLDGWLLSPARTNLEGGKPTTISILESLTDQVRQWRTQTPNWITLIAQQRRSLDGQNIEDAEMASVSAGSHQSTGSSRPSSLPRSGRESFELPNPRKDHRGRVAHSIRSEVFGSIDGSLSSSPLPSNPLQQRLDVGSPLRESLLAPSEAPSSRMSSRNGSADRDPLRNRLPIPPSMLREGVTSSGVTTPSERGSEDASNANVTVSLSHILTNAIILQEFIFEIAAVIQLRACLFGEVTL
jgi:Retinoic acid induced 16-like protein/Family of unknown function (DUF5917)